METAGSDPARELTRETNCALGAGSTGLKLERFDRKKVKAGDKLVATANHDLRFVFKFMGHDGDVVASWVNPLPGSPKDVIVRQRDVLMVAE